MPDIGAKERIGLNVKFETVAAGKFDEEWRVISVCSLALGWDAFWKKRRWPS